MPTVTHIFGLDVSQVGGGQILGLKAEPVPGKVYNSSQYCNNVGANLFLQGLVAKATSCAYLSGIRNGDVIKMCATVNKNKIGTPVCFQRLYEIEEDSQNLEKILKEKKPFIIAVKRPF